MRVMKLKLKISFRTSKSKNFNTVIKLASEFDMFAPGEMNTVELNGKDIIQKWDAFNLLFWKTVGWKGTTLELNEIIYHSHTDKTRIFYALQQYHLNHICTVEEKIKAIKKRYPDPVTKLEYMLMFN